MENVVFLILFTYPGAFVEFVYKGLAKDRAFYREPDAAFRAARIFFFSVAMTLVCMGLFGMLTGARIEISNVIDVLKKGNNLIPYTFLTVAVSTASGALWYAIRSGIYQVANHMADKAGKPRMSRNGQTWMCLMENEKIPQTECVFEIRKDGKLIKAGIPVHCPDDLRKDKGFVLCHCKTIEKILRTEKQDLIDEPSAYYIDTETNTEIIIRGAKKYYDWLES